MIDEYYTHLIYGYYSDDLKPHSSKPVVVVCDKCGLYASLSMDNYSRNNDICRPCANIGINRGKRTPEQNAAQSKSHLAPKEPLPDGWQSKLSNITDNKSSPVYLGSVAETILSNIYTDVRVMPCGNHGYDVICNRDFKIDIKSSATGDKLGYWQFRINKNQIADHFLCIAFNNRDDLYNPVHLWMIPADKVNHLTGLSISKGTLYKWQQYELSIDKLVACCDTIR